MGILQHDAAYVLRISEQNLIRGLFTKRMMERRVRLEQKPSYSILGDMCSQSSMLNLRGRRRRGERLEPMDLQICQVRDMLPLPQNGRFIL